MTTQTLEPQATASAEATAATTARRAARAAVLVALVVAVLAVGTPSAAASTSYTTYGPYNRAGSTGPVTVTLDCRFGTIASGVRVATIPNNRQPYGLTKVVIAQDLQRWNGSRWVGAGSLRGYEVRAAYYGTSAGFGAAAVVPSTRGYYRVVTGVFWQSFSTGQALGYGTYYTPHCWSS